MVIRRTSMVDLPTLPTLAVFFSLSKRYFQQDVHSLLIRHLQSGLDFKTNHWGISNSTPKKLSAGFLLAKHQFSMVISPIGIATPRKITESAPERAAMMVDGDSRIHESSRVRCAVWPNGWTQWMLLVIFHGFPWNRWASWSHHEAIGLLLRLCDRLVENFFADLAFQKGHMPGLIENTYPGDDDPW